MDEIAGLKDSLENLALIRRENEAEIDSLRSALKLRQDVVEAAEKWAETQSVTEAVRPEAHNLWVAVGNLRRASDGEKVPHSKWCNKTGNGLCNDADCPNKPHAEEEK